MIDVELKEIVKFDKIGLRNWLTTEEIEFLLEDESPEEEEIAYDE